MASPAEIVAKIDAAMLANPGVSKMEIDGQTVWWDLEMMIKMRSIYAAKAAQAASTNKLPIRICHLRPGAAN